MARVWISESREEEGTEAVGRCCRGSLEIKPGRSKVNLHRGFDDIGEVDRQVDYVLSHTGHVSVIVCV